MIPNFLNYHLLLKFDMVFNHPHTEGYDPIKVIEDFWKKYDINSSRDHIVFLLLKSLGREKCDTVKYIDEKELKDYSLELMRLLVAYYLCHIHNIDLSELEVPSLVQGKLTDEELKFRQESFRLFGDKKETKSDEL